MGSLSDYRQRGQSHADYFSERLLGGNDKMLDSHAKNGVFYAAIERGGEVFAAIVPFSWGRGYWNFTYKAMAEDEGPHYYDCPVKILDLLTPTESEFANGWREKCREAAERRAAKPKVKPGDTVKFARPIPFTDGSERDTFTLVKGSTFTLRPGGYGQYRITRWRDRDYELVTV